MALAPCVTLIFDFQNFSMPQLEGERTESRKAGLNCTKKRSKEFRRQRCIKIFRKLCSVSCIIFAEITLHCNYRGKKTEINNELFFFKQTKHKNICDEELNIHLDKSNNVKSTVYIIISSYSRVTPIRQISKYNRSGYCTNGIRVFNCRHPLSKK